MPAGGSVATGSAHSIGKVVDDVEVCPLHTLDHKLGNSVTTGDLGRYHPIVIDQVHQDFAPVAGVDGPGRVDDRHAQLRGEPGARVHQPTYPSGSAIAIPVRTSARSPGPSSTSCAAYEIGAGVARVRVRGQRQVRVELPHEHVHPHASHPAASVRARSRTLACVASPNPYRERLSLSWWLWLPAVAVAGGAGRRGEAGRTGRGDLGRLPGAAAADRRRALVAGPHPHRGVQRGAAGRRRAHPAAVRG